MAIQFYTNPHSRGQIARWALHEAGADYEQKIIAYGPEMKSEAYRAINPMGKVPAIVDDGRVVTEVAAICAYLADRFPEAGLGPDDGNRADYYRWLFFAAGPLESAISNHAMGFEPKEEQRRMAGYGSYDEAVAVLEQHLGGTDYVAGERFTMADVYVGSHVSWGIQFGTLPDRPALRAYSERLVTRPAYREAKAIDEKLGKQQ
ncbi:glutathione S-transferase family protein [Sphingomicrobium lutaoense]|uniref:Glutathione S-transferase n=1 Tax=Sphingomicrobium lutaoense TaxID=515949 RepID=A0A839YSQ3_9SPHN|nr:glutathione S-transferase family protein [Sphingomicrobium lutaoense]MBB3763321.1 glutathione S-transferase [Sphingomicrobium lutaoense]